MDAIRLIELTADIVAAHVANNRFAVGDVPELVARVHGALAGLDAPPGTPGHNIITDQAETVVNKQHAIDYFSTAVNCCARPSKLDSIGILQSLN